VNPKDFFAELKRRNVYKVAVAYAVVAWLLIQAASILLPAFDAPPWVIKAFIAIIILCFPIALVLSWAFEITPEGIKLESEIALNESSAPRTGRRIVGLTIAVAMVAAGMLTFQLLRSKSLPAKPALTEAQNLIQQARASIDDPLAVRENFRLAEELGQRAVQLNPTDAEAWAVLAQASLSLIADRYDDTPARREAAGSQAERAIQLDPNSLEAGLAMAGHLSVSRQFSESESRARELLRRFPTDHRVVLLLVNSLHWQNRDEEIRELLRQHAKTPKGRTDFLEWEAYDRFDKNDLVEADALLDQLFAGKPTSGSYLTRLLTLWTGWGDLPAAAKFVEKIPSQLLLEDAFAHHAASVWMEMGETEKALETLRRIPREFLEEKRVIRPKGLLTGRILQAAGRTEAAKVEWQQALALVEKRLAAEPGRADWVRLKALLLGQLGERAEGEKQLKLWQEISGIPAPDQADQSLDVQMALGNYEEVIRGFQAVINSKKGRWLSRLNSLRHDPLYAPIRSDPRVRELIATGEAWLNDLHEKKRQGSRPTSSSSPAIPDNKSIAVRAFTNLSDDNGNEYSSTASAKNYSTRSQRCQG
jgi:tetratricopeptide (TPR) repeat protein